MGTRRSRKRFDSLYVPPPLILKKHRVDLGCSRNDNVGLCVGMEVIESVNHSGLNPGMKGISTEEEVVIGQEENDVEEVMEEAGSEEGSGDGGDEIVDGNEQGGDEVGDGDARGVEETNNDDIGDIGENDALEEIEADDMDSGGDSEGEGVEIEEEGILNTPPITIWALLQTGGSRRVSVEQYGSIRTMVSKMLPGSNVRVRSRALPHYRTLMRKYRPIVMDQLAVKAVNIASEINTAKRGARACLMRKSSRFGRISFVDPIEYAVADFCNPLFLSRLKASVQSGDTGVYDAMAGDENPIVQAREWFYGAPKFIDVDARNGGCFNFAEAGDVIDIRVIGVVNFSAKPWVSFRGEDDMVWRGVLSTVFICKNTTEKRDKEEVCEDARAVEIRRALSMLAYKWPTKYPLVVGDVHPPFVQPTDIVAVVRPVVVGHPDRVVIVCRYARREGERSRFLFVIRGCTDLTTFGTSQKKAEKVRGLADIIFDQYVDYEPSEGFDARKADIRGIKMRKEHGGPRGPEKYKACAALGTLESGEQYGVYRFALYLDGFKASQFGNSSFEGIYIQPLSVTAPCRNDSATARVITVIPPGMKKGPVLRHLIDKIVEGMTDGVVIYDADNTRRRIFLDMVNILGDTPGLNAFLDFGGHTGNEFCHRCRISKTTTNALGNRCLRGDCDWTKVCMRRTSDRTASLRVSKAPKARETLPSYNWANCSFSVL